MPSQACGPDTPSGTTELFTSLPPSAPSEDNEDETSEKFMNFWSSLPGALQLKTKGIDRLQRKKSDAIFDTALSDLVSVTTTAEKNEVADIKQRSVVKYARSSLLLDSARLAHPTFLQPGICNGLGDFLESTPKSWSAEMKTIQSDLKAKLKNRVENLKPKISKGSRMAKINEAIDIKSVLMKTREIENEALKQKISSARKEAIKSELSDMDLWNRPLFYMTTNAEPTVSSETPSTTSMRDDLMKKLSQDTCDFLNSPEPKLSASGRRLFKNPENTDDNESTKSPEEDFL